MKKFCLFVLVVFLISTLGTAMATENFTISKIETAEGDGEIFRSMAMVENVYLLSAKRHLYVLDTATGARNVLFESDKLNIVSDGVLGLVYDSWRDRILIQMDQELLTFVSETAYEVVAYLPPVWSDCRAIGEDGLLLLLNDQSIYALSTLQDDQLSKPLQVACDNLEDWMEKGFAEAYPDIPVKHRQIYAYESIDLLAEQINIQSDEIDIFEIPVGSTAQKVIEKGYYIPLGQSKGISEAVAAYRPFFQQAVTRGGEIVGALRKTEQHTLGYSRYALAQLGLTASDMPSSFLELMDFLLDWNERVGDVAQQKEITPFGITNEQLKTELLALLLDQYYLLMEEDMSAVPLYKAELAELLDKLSAVCAAIPEPMEEEQSASPFERFARIQVNDQPSYLFDRYCSFLPGRRNFSNGGLVSDFVPIALTLPSQERPFLLFEGTLFIVNPYSSQKARAIQWIEFYMSHMPGGDSATFDGDASPLEFETYEAMRKYYTEEIARMESRIEAAEGAAKSTLESQLQAMQETLRGLEQIKWDVSAQALEDYGQAFVQCDALWVDRVSVSAFNKTYAAYLAEGLPGKTVANAFFSAYEMVLRESR